MSYLKASKGYYTIYIRCEDLESEELLGGFFSKSGYEVISLGKTAFYSGKLRHDWISVFYDSHLYVECRLNKYSKLKDMINDLIELGY